MSKQHSPSILVQLFGGLGWPLMFGLAACSSFYVLIFQGPLNHPTVHRYFATHPVSYLATGMFCVGVAALVMKFVEVIGEASACRRDLLPAPPTGGQKIHEAIGLLESLDEFSAKIRHSYLARRLADGLHYVHRRGTAEGLDDELKYLADQDAVRQQNSFALVRIIIWATPMLGFLGTVIGVAQALGNLDPTELASSAETAMQKLMAGLYVAFDTTALALCLSIVMMFLQFFVDRFETQVLDRVDHLAARSLSGRFQQFAGRLDPYVVPIERMSQAVLRSCDELVQRQSALWQESLTAMQAKWDQLLSNTGETIAETLDNSLKEHAERLKELETSAVAETGQRWQRWQEALESNTRLMAQQREELVNQGVLMSRAIEVTGDVVKLEEALNRNLHSLASTQDFQETVVSLSAAIQLLGAQLARGDNSRGVKLQAEDSSNERAA